MTPAASGGRTPVLVGAGAVTQRPGETIAADATGLMIEALERVAVDGGCARMLRDTGAVFVPRGTWTEADPGRAIAARFGAGSARSVLAEVGVLQQTVLSRACDAVARGDIDVAVVCGGEAKRSAPRTEMGERRRPAPAPSAGVGPDEVLSPHGSILTRLEIERGLAVPAHQYAVIETALRAAAGASVADHAAELAGLCASFSRVAAGNPEAWRRDAVDPALLSEPSEANPMLVAPYTKLHCSQWNVDQAAALVLCSVEAAQRTGTDPQRWVFPHAAAESNAMIPLTERAALHRSPAFVLAGAAVLGQAGLTIDDVGYLDLYSCFPSAVRVQAAELDVPPGRPLTVTGGMTFVGGPLNNYTLQALVAMAGRLRADPAAWGLVTNVSGMLTKQGAGLWSCRAPTRPYRTVDVTDDAHGATATVHVDAGYTGPARVEGYTVVHDRGRPARAVVVAVTPDGHRAVATSDDPGLAAAMTAGEWCGRAVAVTGPVLDS